MQPRAATTRDPLQPAGAEEGCGPNRPRVVLRISGGASRSGGIAALHALRLTFVPVRLEWHMHALA